MKILITGTNGFVGRNLKEYFQARYEDLHCPKRQELDLLDSEAVWEYVTARQLDVVIHCAVSLLSVEHNLKMYFNLERCTSSLRKLLCVGSGAEYDLRYYTPKMKEGYFGKHIPAEIYGFSKYVIAKDIETKHRNIYNLRVFGIYGKYEDFRRRFISNNICRVLSGMNISIRKNMYFDYLNVDDFSRIVDMFVNKQPSDWSYNICTGKSVDLVTLATIIRAVHGKDVDIVVKEDGLGPEYSGDNSRFLQDFGDFKFKAIEAGIADLFRWYKHSSNIAFDKSIFT